MHNAFSSASDTLIERDSISSRFFFSRGTLFLGALFDAAFFSGALFDFTLFGDVFLTRARFGGGLFGEISVGLA